MDHALDSLVQLVPVSEGADNVHEACTSVILGAGASYHLDRAVVLSLALAHVGWCYSLLRWLPHTRVVLTWNLAASSAHFNLLRYFM